MAGFPFFRWPFACLCDVMRSLWQSNGKSSRTTTIVVIAVLAEGPWNFGCGAGGASPPPPPPPSIEVTLKPANGLVVLGGQTTFSATVTNTTDTAVTWSVSGVPGGNATLGMNTSAGMYSAPPDLLSPATVQVMATSHADSTKSGTLSITSEMALGLTPNPATVELGATQAFQAMVTSGGHPDTAFRWSLSGPACASVHGTIDASGVPEVN